MPTVTIERSVTIQDTAEALRAKLGDRYEVTRRGEGSHEALRVKQSATSTATVHVDQKDGSTTLRVVAGGLIISRLINEFGIAKKVAAALEEAFKPATNG
jgi:hypothetical protein